MTETIFQGLTAPQWATITGVLGVIQLVMLICMLSINALVGDFYRIINTAAYYLFSWINGVLIFSSTALSLIAATL